MNTAMASPEIEEQELLSRLGDGDERAFNEIYQMYWRKMADYAIRLTRSEEEGADIVQEIFVSIWTRRKVLEVKGTLAAYLMKSTRNLSLRYIEQNFTRHGFLERFTRHMQHANTVLEDRLSVQQLQEHVDRTVAKLPDRMRQVYLLSRDEQLSHREIAQRLGIAETTVKKQISNALKILAGSLSRGVPGAIPFIFTFLYYQHPIS